MPAKIAILLTPIVAGGLFGYALARRRKSQQLEKDKEIPLVPQKTPTVLSPFPVSEQAPPDRSPVEQSRPWENAPLSEDSVNYAGPIPDVPKSSADACEEYMVKMYGPNWREVFRKRIEEYPWRSKDGKRNALTTLDAMCRKGHLWELGLVSLTNLAQVDRSAYYDEVSGEARTLKDELYQAVLRLENPGFYNTTHSVAESLAADVIHKTKQAGFGPCIFSWEYQGKSMPMLQPYYQRVLNTYWPDGNFEACGPHDYFKDIERVTLQRWNSM